MQRHSRADGSSTRQGGQPDEQWARDLSIDSAMAVRCGIDRRRIGTMGLDSRVGPSAGTTIATSTECPSSCSGRANWVSLRTRCASGLPGPPPRRRRVVVRRLMMASTSIGARTTDAWRGRSSVGSRPPSVGPGPDALVPFCLGRPPSYRSLQPPHGEPPETGPVLSFGRGISGLEPQSHACQTQFPLRPSTG
jgi:hypothetical protein